MPLIFQIRDSSSQFLSNVTFGTSFTFQMWEEYIFDFFLENLTSRVINSGVPQLHTQFTHASRHF